MHTNTYLIKMSPENLPKGAPAKPEHIAEWADEFKFARSISTHTIQVRDNHKKAMPAPQFGDTFYIWVHETKGGKGLTAKGTIVNPSISPDRKTMTFNMAKLELITQTVNFSKKHPQGSFIQSLYTSVHNGIWYLHDEDVTEIENEIARLITDLHSREARYDEKSDKSLHGLSETEREAVVQARRGQGQFREELIEYWQECAVTGLKIKGLLRASHIKAWRDSNNDERLDTFNGLLLNPTLDLAFDKHIISFDKNGHILISNDLNSEDRQKLSISPTMKLQKYEPRHEEYMAIHRAEFMKKEAKA